MEESITLEMVLKELHQVSGFRISIHDIEFNEIASYPKSLSQFCTLIQQHPGMHKSCMKNDMIAFEYVKKHKTPYIYRCRFGLYEAVAPLYYSGILSGYLMMGQALDTSIHTKEHVYNLSSGYVEDQQQLKMTIDAIPAATREKITSYLNIMSICAEYITLSNRLRVSSKNLSQEVKKYIEEHYREKITLEKLCDQFYCSKGTLTSSFKQTYGQTINHFITQVRVQKAQQLMNASGMKIGEVAAQCGFSDQNYFCKVFIKVFGMTPSEYAKTKGEYKEQ